MNTLQEQLHAYGVMVEYYDCVDSTNRLAKECAEQGAPEGRCIISNGQTAGRGRLGRTFCSPADTGLYMSVVLRPTLAPEKVLSVTTAAAVAVCRAIERVSDRKAQIKWVNDIYCDGKKVCGILTEAGFADGKLNYAVLGIGINVQDPADGFPDEIKTIAASVFGNAPADRTVLAVAVLEEFFEEYEHLAEERFVEEYRARSCLVDKNITVIKPSGNREALAIGVDGQCRLLVRYTDGEEETLSSGDVSIQMGS